MPAVNVDVASKPTLASYTIRPDAFDPKAPGPPNKLQTSKSRDDAMLAVLDRQCEVADAKIKSRDFKGAITLLRRTYALVNAHSSPAPATGRALVNRLASACLRLQLCAALSRIGRHAPALDEAEAAKAEMEDVWQSLTGAAVDMAMAEAGGDTTKPHPVLRSHICNPPSWLERAIACSVQSRLCIALETEYLLLQEGPISQEIEVPPSPLLPPIDGAPLHQLDSLDDLEWEGQVGMPMRPHTPAQQLEQLYKEAIDLANRLLPANHALLQDTEKAAQAALFRQQARQVPPEPTEPAQVEVLPPATPMTPAPAAPRQAPPSPPPASPAEVRRVSLASLPDRAAADEDDLNRLSKDLLSRTKRKPMLRSSQTMPSLDSALTTLEEDGGAILSQQEKEDCLNRRNTDSNSHGDWVRRSPPGDVFYRSLPWSFKEATTGSRSSSRRRRKKKAQAQQESLSTSTEPSEHDPFKDWAKQYMHVENMTLFQRKLLTLEGIGSLHTDMKIETKRFRQFMHDLELYGEDDRLGNNRILYTDAGVKALRIGQARNEAVRKAAWKATPYALEFAEREKDLFAYYGMSRQYEKGVDVKCLRKILDESFSRTPAEKARRKAEEDQRRRQEMEEAEAKKRELSQIGFRKSKSRMTASKGLGATR